MLEKIARKLKNVHSSLNPEEQFQAAKHLVRTLSAMLDSPSENCMTIFIS